VARSTVTPDPVPVVLRVAMDAPAHSGLGAALDYLSERGWAPGTLLRAPLGKRELLGIVWHVATAELPDMAAPDGQSDYALRTVGEVFDALPPMTSAWLALVDFAAGYYQRGIGELALSVLPPALRKLDAAGLNKRLARLVKKFASGTVAQSVAAPRRPDLAPEQLAALAAFEAARGQSAPMPMLLHGVTGSGKTEVSPNKSSPRIRTVLWLKSPCRRMV
jgi:primosomal protein N' (replication factor Y)